MILRENDNVELKEQYSKTILKTAVAFANTNGGVIYVGVANDGTVVGIDDTDDLMLRISSSLRASILPDIMPFVQIKAIELDHKLLIEITISIGSRRPYYVRANGLTPDGVFIRRGTACQPLSVSGIRDMIIETSGKSYEMGRSLVQALSFHTFTQEMEMRGIKCSHAQMKTLHILGTDDLYTNLALLISDQCPYTIKVAVFQGKDKTVFRDRKEFSGSVFKQLHDTYEFLDLFNKTKASFSGLIRKDVRDYPEDALRETLLNCLIHRDYSFSGSTIINLFDDHIEFVSLGGLVTGMSLESILMGISQSRNPNLAAIFYRMKLVESYGTGINKIQNLYASSNLKPIFQAAEGGFLVKLYNLNEEEALTESLQAKDDKASAFTEIKQKDPSTEEETIYQFALKHGSVNRLEVETLLGCKTTKAFRLLKKLCAKGLLSKIANGKLSRYAPVSRSAQSH